MRLSTGTIGLAYSELVIGSMIFSLTNLFNSCSTFERIAKGTGWALKYIGLVPGLTFNFTTTLLQHPNFSVNSCGYFYTNCSTSVEPIYKILQRSVFVTLHTKFIFRKFIARKIISEQVSVTALLYFGKIDSNSRDVLRF